MCIVCGEFDELWSCVFECLEERVHAVDATEAESSHELDSVSLACAIECFDGGIGLLRREHTAHHSSQVNVHVCVLWPWKQLQQQVRKRQMLVCVHPRLSVRTRRQHANDCNSLAESEHCVVSAVHEMGECKSYITRCTP